MSEHEPVAAAASAPARRRGVRTVALLLGVSVLSGGLGWLAARRVRSPADVAARAEAPTASRITAPVELRLLRSTLITRGTVRFASPDTVTLPVSASKTSLIVTSPPVKGAELTEGSKAADVGGRPVLVLQGPVPMYRDIRPGDEGDDVAELKTALNRLGFDAGTGTRYDAKAQAAVSAWMDAAGYDAFGPTEAQQSSLRSAREAVRRAQDQVDSARNALSKTADAITTDKVLSADEAVRAAVDRAAAARTDAARTVAQAELAVEQKQAAVESAQRAIDRARTDLSGTIAVTDAQQALTAANQRVADGDATIDKARHAVDTAGFDHADAKLAVADAQASLDAANVTVANAQKDLDRIKARPAPTIQVGGGVSMVDTESQDGAVRQGEASVQSAQAGVRAATASLRSAERGVQRAWDAVLEAQSQFGKAIDAAATAREGVKVAAMRLDQARLTAADSASGSSTGGAGSGAGSGGSTLDQNLRFAQADLAAAREAVASAKRSGDAAVRAADAQVRIARAQRTELAKPVDASTQQLALRSALDAKADAVAELDRLQSSTGIVVPANEVLFFTSLPLRVDDTKVVAGAALQGPLMTVASQRLAIDASVDPADGSSLRVGQAAEVEATDLNLIVPATVTKVASKPGTNGVDASRLYVELEPSQVLASSTGAGSVGSVGGSADTTDAAESSERTSLADLAGMSLKVTIPISSTDSEVLAVPTAAVSAAADGSIRVEVEDSPGAATRSVKVIAGLRAEGYVAVTPVEAGALREGDQVVTGRKDGTLLQGTVESNDQPGSGSP